MVFPTGQRTMARDGLMVKEELSIEKGVVNTPRLHVAVTLW